MVERQDPDNFPRLQTREWCALEISAYVFKVFCAQHLVTNYQGQGHNFHSNIHSEFHVQTISPTQLGQIHNNRARTGLKSN